MHPKIRDTSAEQTTDRRRRSVLAAGAVLRKAKEGEKHAHLTHAFTAELPPVSPPR